MFFAYVRIKFKFWAIQPVMHVYDVKYWFWKKGIIQLELPEKNKYCNFKAIETIPFDKVGDIKTNQFVNLIQTNYLRENENMFLPLNENIIPYFVGHNSSSFWSFYWEDSLIQDIKKNSIIKDKHLIGAITSKPLHVIIHNGNKNAKLNVYYVDYLCIDMNHRKKGVAQDLIQTHEYNQSHLNLSIQVSLFKREGELTGIVPLCVYTTYAFSMKNWCKPTNLDGNVHLIQCGKENIHYLLPLLQKEDIFDITIVPTIGNVLELIITENIFVYMLLSDIENENEVIGAYFFRKSCTYIKKNAEALVCFASILTKDAKYANVKYAAETQSRFIHGYKVALSQICEHNVAKQTKLKNKNNNSQSFSTYQYAVVEDISSNNLIIANLLEKTSPLMMSPTAYFFYNFAYPTFKSSKVLIIN